MSDYKPIACVLHEQYQYAVMKRAELDLNWVDGGGTNAMERLRPLDVYTRHGAEYLLVLGRDGEKFEIRLDWIKQARWSHDGTKLKV